MSNMLFLYGFCVEPLDLWPLKLLTRFGYKPLNLRHRFGSRGGASASRKKLIPLILLSQCQQKKVLPVDSFEDRTCNGIPGGTRRGCSPRSYVSLGLMKSAARIEANSCIHVPAGLLVFAGSAVEAQQRNARLHNIQRGAVCRLF